MTSEVLTTALIIAAAVAAVFGIPRAGLALLDRSIARRSARQQADDAGIGIIAPCPDYYAEPAAPAPTGPENTYRRRPTPSAREATVQRLTAHLDAEYAALVADYHRKGGAQ